jgi:hypothetical protein
MNTFLLALQLMVADTSNHPFPYIVHVEEKSIDWKKYEASVSKKFRDSVINSFKSEFREKISDEFVNTDRYYKSFHFVHLNDDKLPDVIYNGWTGGEADAIFMYYNHGNVLEEVFYDYSTIVDWKFERGHLSSIVINRPGCCAATVETERVYRVDSLLNFEMIRQREIIIGMNKRNKGYVTPDEYFKQPIRFQTINNDYALRYSPEITAKAPLHVDDEFKKGNIIALYPKGASGIAWARKTDATGREWWLVEMEPQSLLSFNIYYNEDDKPTWYFGWMSSRFLEKTP